MSIFAVIAVAASVAAFQQYEIGMSLEAARAIEIPSGNYGSIDFACTGDANAPRFLQLTDGERATGITKPVYPIDACSVNL